jgi:acyl-CoA dehydrogenase
VIDGRKRSITGAAHLACRVAIVMGVSDDTEDAPRHARHARVLVPMDTPRLTVLRNVPVMNHLAPEGHCELMFHGVRVPVENLLGEAGQGFAMAQAWIAESPIEMPERLG